MYAYFKKLDYFSTECIYSPNAYRGFARELIKELERVRPQTILDIIRSAETFKFNTQEIRKQVLTRCEKCNYISSQQLCRACVFLDGLNRGTAKVALYETHGVVKNNKKKFVENLDKPVDIPTDNADIVQKEDPEKRKRALESLNW